MDKLKKLLKVFGPGFITGASDDDPSGIGTYSQTGAQFGYSQSWLSLFSFPFMTVVQEMCGRIGMVTGKGLSEVIKENYTRPILYISVSLLLLANMVNIGADLGAMASSGQLLVGVPFWVWLVGVTIVTLLLQILVPYPSYAKYLKYLTFSLFAYILTAFVVKQDWGQIVLATLIPSFSFSKDYLLNVVAILGTTISPYLFFWQSDEEVEEEIEEHKIRAMGKGIPKVTKYDMRSMRLDTILGMFFSNVVMFFIIVTTASTLGAHGITSIQTADDAARALQPLAGNFTFILFAAGIIGTGLLAVPVLAGSASYAVGEALNIKVGLNRKFNQARGFYLIIIFATVIGLAVNFTPIKPFQLLYYTAILNGIVAPPLLVMLLLISNNKNILGKYTNGLFSNILGIGITVIMGVAAIALLISLFQG